MIRRNDPFTGWQVLDGLTGIFFIPFSVSFEYKGMIYMASTDAQAEGLANMIVRDCDNAWSDYFRAHPELNP